MTIIPDVCACGQSSCSDPLAAGKWMQLPIAPVANHRILFDGDFKKYKALYPQGVIGWLEEEDKKRQIRGIQISGPGDPMAEPQVLVSALDLLGKSKLSLRVEIKCLGLGTEKMADTLAGKNVSQVNMEVLAVDPDTVLKLYAWVRPGKKNIPLAYVADVLIDEQKKGVRALSKAGVKVNILTTVYPGINDNVVEDICREMAIAGAHSIALVPFSRPKQSEEEMETETEKKVTEIEKIPFPPDCDNELIDRLRKMAKKYLETGEPRDNTFSPLDNNSEDDNAGILGHIRPRGKRTNVAVASGSGLDIDIHLGQAEQLLIYGPRADDTLPCLLETRAVSKDADGNSSRWDQLSDILGDCFALLVTAAGDKPKTALAEHGISVLQAKGKINAAVDRLYGGGKKKKKC